MYANLGQSAHRRCHHSLAVLGKTPTHNNLTPPKQLNFSLNMPPGCTNPLAKHTSCLHWPAHVGQQGLLLEQGLLLLLLCQQGLLLLSNLQLEL